MKSRYDVAVVGAGSAGCVLASQLSEDADREVVLFEAGPDYPSPSTSRPGVAGSGRDSEASRRGFDHF